MLNLIVTCARRMYCRPTRRLYLRLVRRLPASRRVGEWVAHLTATAGESVPAADLYRGDHWAHSLRAADRVARFGGRAWVGSAGYGLVPLSARLHPYSATFAPGDPDPVPDPAGWWDALADWEGPAPGQPRRLADLVAGHPDRIVMAVVSEPYLRALTPDLAAARAALGRVDCSWANYDVRVTSASP